MTARLPVAVSIGDPHGIGPEVAVAAARALLGSGLAPVLVGDRHVIASVAGEGAPLRAFTGASNLEAGTIPVHDVRSLPADAYRPGRPTAASGIATVAYLEAALALTTAGETAAIVAAPHSETAINAAGIPFAGYPSLLASLLERDPDEVFLMLIGGGLRIVHATLHERLLDALGRLTPELVCAAAGAAAAALPKLGVASPRIGLLAINPHAGEGGLFGDDDARVNEPAARALRDQGIDAVGPRGADLMLSDGTCDAYVAMYHDQGHIPVKLRAGRRSVALSIGAGVAFASVGHGAAFDIAGAGGADPAPLIAALELFAAAQRLPAGAP